MGFSVSNFSSRFSRCCMHRHRSDGWLRPGRRHRRERWIVVEGELVPPFRGHEPDSKAKPQPNPPDWDENFPAGWHSSDVTSATGRVFSRIPGTSHPSKDRKLYLDQGFNVLAAGLNSSRKWQFLPAANAAPNKKNHTFAHTEFMFSGGERGGPLATYLKTAAARSNFDLWTDTAGNRIVRNGSHATGVEVSCALGTGYTGTVNLTPNTGRVIISAGTFGTPKVLFRSKSGLLSWKSARYGVSRRLTMIMQVALGRPTSLLSFRAPRMVRR